MICAQLIAMWLLATRPSRRTACGGDADALVRGHGDDAYRLARTFERDVVLPDGTTHQGRTPAHWRRIALLIAKRAARGRSRYGDQWRTGAETSQRPGEAEEDEDGYDEGDHGLTQRGVLGADFSRSRRSDSFTLTLWQFSPGDRPTHSECDGRHIGRADADVRACQVPRFLPRELRAPTGPALEFARAGLFMRPPSRDGGLDSRSRRPALLLLSTRRELEEWRGISSST
jgi:hypothetical protein